MVEKFLSIAIWEPLPDMETVSFQTMRELNAIMSRKQYGHDTLYRSGDSQYVLLRCWNSEQARSAAQEDPDVLRCWARLGNEIKIVKVYEKLEELGG
jgi:hypothetical protein